MKLFPTLYNLLTTSLYCDYSLSSEVYNKTYLIYEYLLASHNTKYSHIGIFSEFSIFVFGPEQSLLAHLLGHIMRFGRLFCDGAYALSPGA